MSARSMTPEVVKLRDVTDLAAFVPHMLGFRPVDSLVVVAMIGRRERLGFSLRLDLLPPVHDEEVAQMCAARMSQAGAGAVLAFVYTSRPTRPGWLPRHALVDAIEEALPMPLRDALLVADDRVWSYRCDDTRCCPPEGRPLRPDSPVALTIAAAHAFNGDVIMPSREALVATTRAVGGVAAASMSQAIDRALDAYLASVRDEPDVVDGSLLLLDRICSDSAEAPSSLTHDDAAALTVRSHNVGFRDAVIARLARGDNVLEGVLTRLARLAQPPFDAPAATMLAVTGYFRGDGVVALAAAQRALETDPDYSLAKLVVDAIDRQLDPDHMRRIWSRHRR